MKQNVGQINRRKVLRMALSAATGGLGALLGAGQIGNAAERSAIEYAVLRDTWQTWRDEEHMGQGYQANANAPLAASDPAPNTRTSPAPSRAATPKTAVQTPTSKNGPTGTGVAKSTASTTSTAASTGYEVPTRLVIPDISLDVPIQTVGIIYSRGGAEWGSPAWRAAGWHNTSSKLGEPGNLVLNGHNNIYGRVFSGLYNLKPGNLVTIRGATRTVVYRLSHYLLLREAGQPVSVLMENAKHILPTGDTRLTMVTCWPITNNTHRWIWIGYPTT
ncbi:MAG: sortase [Anaerolineae bacterium]|nr:sortase [Anaerolineae bacterium]